jgi:hypothetical protein
LFVSFDVTTDLSASVISDSNYRMACTRTRQQEHCRERPRKQFHVSCLPTCDADHALESDTRTREELWCAWPFRPRNILASVVAMLGSFVGFGQMRVLAFVVGKIHRDVEIDQ